MFNHKALIDDPDVAYDMKRDEEWVCPKCGCPHSPAWQWCQDCMDSHPVDIFPDGL